MEGRTKGDATRREHHGLEKAPRNQERGDSGHPNGTLDKHTEPISGCGVTGEPDGREGE